MKPDLSSIDLFRGLDSEQITRLLESAHERRVEEGTYLFMQEDPATKFFVLKGGRLKLAQLTAEGHQVIMHYVAPGEAFGIIAALSGMTYPVYAQAVEESTYLFWDKETIQRLMLEIPQLSLNGMHILARHIRTFQERLREASTQRVERRIARTLIRLARQAGRKTDEGILIDLPLSRQDLADMTGTTLYTVSRTLSQWESLGLVRSRREQVVICYAHGLVMIAEDLPPGRAASPLPDLIS